MTDGSQVSDTGIQRGVPRRQALCGILAMGLIGPAALAACSNETTPNANTGDVDKGGLSKPAPSTGNNAGRAVATMSELSTGSGKIVTAPDGKPVVLVRGADGTVRGFMASCTHQGVTVGTPKAGVLTCPQHGSTFSAADGTVTKGPAAAALPSVPVTVNGDDIILG